ncbi:MAG: hypothetical protein OSJ70_05880 [Bacilli bacterium]|nr:hypothetical protein [Bacilli bacterium]
MKINLVCPIIILDNVSNPDIRKNDVKIFKLLVNKRDNGLVSVGLNENKSIKNTLRNHIKNIIGSDKFHLEQVYTLGEERYYIDSSIDIIHLAVMNAEEVKKLDVDYVLIDFSINNNVITFGNKKYSFRTVEEISNNNIEYFHRIDVDDLYLEKCLLEILIAYKHLKMKLDFSDIIFKFMGNTFTLEEVRNVYELIKSTSVDKSNFRKRIIKYCEEVSVESVKRGYRPSKVYKFKAMEGDVWL